MSLVARLSILAALMLALPVAVAAQSSSPTLPSDTLEANFAPKSGSGPVPELAPSLPSDTLEAGNSNEMRRDWDQDEVTDARKEGEQQ